MILIVEKLKNREILVAQLLPTINYKVTRKAEASFSLMVKNLKGIYTYRQIPDREVKDALDIPLDMSIKNFCALNLKNNTNLKWHDEGAQIRTFFAVKGRQDNRHTTFHVSRSPEVAILKTVCKLENRPHREVHDEVISIGTPIYLYNKGHKKLADKLKKEKAK